MGFESEMCLLLLFACFQVVVPVGCSNADIPPPKYCSVEANTVSAEDTAKKESVERLLACCEKLVTNGNKVCCEGNLKDVLSGAFPDLGLEGIPLYERKEKMCDVTFESRMDESGKAIAKRIQKEEEWAEYHLDASAQGRLNDKIEKIEEKKQK